MHPTRKQLNQLIELGYFLFNTGVQAQGVPPALGAGPGWFNSSYPDHMFARYVELRESIGKRAKKTGDPVDVALAAYCKFRDERTKLRDKSWSSKRYQSFYTRLSSLEQKAAEAFELLMDKAEASSDWIFEYSSPFGLVYVRNSDEAVQIAARVEARKLKGKKLKEWQDRKRKDIRFSWTLIRLGAEGGTVRL